MRMKKVVKIVNVYGKEQLLFNNGSGKTQSVRLNEYTKVPKVILANRNPFKAFVSWVKNQTDKVLWIRGENDEYVNYSLVSKSFYKDYLNGDLAKHYFLKNKNNKQ